MIEDDEKSIQTLIGQLSEAFWVRATRPGVRMLAALRAEYRPESDEERAIWSELTAPHNYAALARGRDGWVAGRVNDWAAALYAAALWDAEERLGQNPSPHGATGPSSRHKASPPPS